LGKTSLLLGDQRHSLFGLMKAPAAPRPAPGVLPAAPHPTCPSASSIAANPPPAPGVSPGPCSHSADQDLQFWWEDAADFTFPPKLEIFTAVFTATRETGRIAAANTCDSRRTQAECLEDHHSQRSLTVHARSCHVGDGHARASTIGPPAPSANTV
jgi:hypothetical protein